MKILAYGVSNWDNKHQADQLKLSLEEWYNRTRCFTGDPKIYMTAGTYSDPDYNPLNLDLIQNGVSKTRPYSTEWNYFRNGFITGIWHALLNFDFDVLLHVQCRTLLGIDITPHIERFVNSSKQIMAPGYTSKTRNIDGHVEVGMIAMKPDAARAFATFGLRSSLSPNKQINCEREALEIFGNEWYNPFPEVKTTRKRERGGVDNEEVDLPFDEFIRLPIIAGHKHASRGDIKTWCKAHPYKMKGGIL